MLRFRKRFNVLPGVKVNLSKSGASFSIFGTLFGGLIRSTLNLGRKPRITNSLTGTGISDVEYLNRD
jgi:hypothetical protein